LLLPVVAAVLVEMALARIITAVVVAVLAGIVQALLNLSLLVRLIR
jgi:hypothetical protein